MDRKLFYRAKLTLEELERHTDSNGYPQVRGMEIAEINVTGDTPADTMVQLCAHADSLCDWHQDQADDRPSPEPVTCLHMDADHPLAKAFAGVGKALFGPDARPVGPLQHIRVGAKDAPGERAAEANQDGAKTKCSMAECPNPQAAWVVCGEHMLDIGRDICAEENPAQPGEICWKPSSHGAVEGTPCRYAPASQLEAGEADDAALRDTEADRDAEMKAALAETHDAYGTPITPLLAEEPAICATCEGRGEVNGRPCPQCTIAATPARASGGYLPGGVMYGRGGDSSTPITPPSPTVDAQNLALAIADPDRQRRGYSHGADEAVTKLHTENRCAVCGDVIHLIDGTWKHGPGLRLPHDPEPANLASR